MAALVTDQGVARGKCGYCNNPHKRATHVMTLEGLDYGDYVRLLNRGWSRHGRMIQFPCKETCCPQYQIRLDTHAFRASRSKRKVLTRMDQFLAGKWDPRNATGPGSDSEEECDANAMMADMAGGDGGSDVDLSAMWQREAALVKRLLEKKEKSRIRSSQAPALPQHTLQMKFTRPHVSDEIYELYELYQRYRHNAEPNRTFYETHCAVDPFCPNPDASPDAARTTDKYGAYFCEYRLDGRLIMVSEVDILPGCLVSYYCFYDPAFAFLQLGTYSALKEIEWVKTHASEGFRWYYLLYVVPGNKRMEYKLTYLPQEILCPVTFRWVPLEPVRFDAKVAPFFARLAPPDPIFYDELKPYVDQGWPMDAAVDVVHLINEWTADLLPDKTLRNSTWLREAKAIIARAAGDAVRRRRPSHPAVRESAPVLRPDPDARVAYNGELLPLGALMQRIKLTADGENRCRDYCRELGPALYTRLCLNVV